jgi:hypothetical protein
VEDDAGLGVNILGLEADGVEVTLVVERGLLRPLFYDKIPEMPNRELPLLHLGANSQKSAP